MMERHVILAVVTLLLCRQMCTDGQIFGSEQRGTGSSYIVQDFTPPVQPTEDDYVVRKTVVSDRMRLVFMVGLEGTGHHMVAEALTDLFASSNLPDLNTCTLAKELYPELVASLSESPLAYAQAHARLAQRMRRLAEAEEVLETYPGAIVSVQYARGAKLDDPCRGTGMMSYPNYAGADKALQYVDLRLMAAAAEEEGVDLRFIYLTRSARDLIVSSTAHHDYDRGYPGAKKAPAEKSFIRYMQIILTEAALLQSMLHELGPGFVVCHRYSQMTHKAQAMEVAEFVAPTAEAAQMFAESLLRVARPTRSSGPSDGYEPRYEGETVIISRLQHKLDALEAAFCRHT